MHVSRIALAALAAATLAAPALATPNAMHNLKNKMAPANATLNINMGAQNGSKEKGTASVMQSGKNIVVKIHLFNAKGSQPAHIHQGSCAKLNPAPFKPLTNVMNGNSTTTLKNMTVGMLKKGRFAINVHQSAANLKKYVSCGDL